MASAKRKSSVAELSSAKIKTKRLRIDVQAAPSSPADERGAKQNPTQGKDSSKSPGSVPISVLANEQPAFPRGGASLLTPIERKQIQAQATRDAIKEHTSSGDLFAASDKLPDDCENEEITEAAPTGPKKKKKKKKRKSVSKKHKPSEDGVNDNYSVRVEGLSYKVSICYSLYAFFSKTSKRG